VHVRPRVSPILESGIDLPTGRVTLGRADTGMTTDLYRQFLRDVYFDGPSTSEPGAVEAATHRPSPG